MAGTPTLAKPSLPSINSIPSSNEQDKIPQKEHSIHKGGNEKGDVEVVDEKNEKEEEEEEVLTYPDGGWRAWFVVVGVCSSFLDFSSYVSLLMLVIELPNDYRRCAVRARRLDLRTRGVCSRVIMRRSFCRTFHLRQCVLSLSFEGI